MPNNYEYLTLLDKKSIVQSHIKAVEHTLYNLEVSEIEASASAGSSTGIYAPQISDCQLRLTALNAELNVINTAIEASE